jgi:hypothetical protein
MRFEVFHAGLMGRHDIVAVDMIHYPGLWGLCFSHHLPNNNHPRYAADTTTAGVLRFLAAHSDLSALDPYTITTHHFDADALLPVWMLLNPRAALERRELLERIARCGDFFIYTDDTSAKLNFVGETLHVRLRSGGARGERLIDDELTRRCFEWLLPRWSGLLDDPTRGEELWAAPMREMLADIDYLAAPGRVSELWDHHTSLVETDHALDAHALNTVCRNDLLVIWRSDTPRRRIDVRPAIGWYDIVSMPHRPRYDLGELAARLNGAERERGHAAQWRHEAGPAWLRADASGLSQAATLAIVKGWLDAAAEEHVPASYRADVLAQFREWPRHAIFTAHERFARVDALRYAPGEPYGGIYPLRPYRLQITADGADIVADALPIVSGPDTKGDAQVRFAVSDDFVWNRHAPYPLELRVTYADHAAGSFWIEYDTWGDPFRPTPSITLAGDGQVHTATFRLDDARMGNSQHGADFRMAWSPAAHLELREMHLARVTGQDGGL